MPGYAHGRIMRSGAGASDELSNSLGVRALARLHRQRSGQAPGTSTSTNSSAGSSSISCPTASSASATSACSLIAAARRPSPSAGRSWRISRRPPVRRSRCVTSCCASPASTSSAVPSVSRASCSRSRCCHPHPQRGTPRELARSPLPRSPSARRRSSSVPSSISARWPPRRRCSESLAAVAGPANAPRPSRRPPASPTVPTASHIAPTIESPYVHARVGFSPTGFIRHARRTTDKSLNVRRDV